jgi:hypothetical protein
MSLARPDYMVLWRCARAWHGAATRRRTSLDWLPTLRRYVLTRRRAKRVRPAPSSTPAASPTPAGKPCTRPFRWCSSSDVAQPIDPRGCRFRRLVPGARIEILDRLQPSNGGQTFLRLAGKVAVSATDTLISLIGTIALRLAGAPACSARVHLGIALPKGQGPNRALTRRPQGCREARQCWPLASLLRR